MKLYELKAVYENFLEAIEAGEIPEEAIADTLESIEADIEEKADSIACLLKGLDADIAAIKAEEDRLEQRRKSKEKTKESIKEYLSSTLLAMGKTQIETARNKISFRKTPPKVVFDDEKSFIEWAILNDDSLLTYGKPTVNKTAIKEAIESGKEINGAKIVVGQNIQIK